VFLFLGLLATSLTLFNIVYDVLNREYWHAQVGELWAHVFFGVFLAVACSFYTDWALAFIAGDMVGHGEGKVAQALSWVYFFSKRIAMLGF